MRVGISNQVATLAALSASIASGAAGAASASTPEIIGVEEIIVTAQKREQSLHDVPIAVTAISGQALADAGALDIKDLTILIPNLIIRSTSDDSVSNARIRGVGTSGDDDGLESSVGLVIDGIYRPRLGVGIGDLGEVERIEVLAGPQGTLFGRNNSAGVINVVTHGPSFDFGLKGEATAGNYGAVGGSGSITGPLVDDVLAGRLFIVARQHDGYNDVRTGDGPRTSEQDKTADYHSVRGQLLYTPTPEISARLIADYSERDEECCLFVNFSDNAALAALAPSFVADGGVLTPATADERIAYANRDATLETKDRGVSLQIDWDTPWLNNAALVSTTGYRDWSSRTANDFDWTSVDISYYDTQRNYRQLSQEIRLAGAAGRFDWLGGVYYSHEVIDRDDVFQFGEDADAFFNALVSAATSGLTDAAALTGDAAFSGAINHDVFQQTDDTWALFTHETFHITDKLHLTAGARYTSGKRKLAADYSSGPGGNACAGAIGAYDSGANPAWEILQAAAPAEASELLGFLCAGYWDPRFGTLGATHQSRTENEWSGTVSLSYDFTERFMAYVGYGRGYKGGGFNFQRVRTAPMGTTTGAAVLGVPNSDTSFAAEYVDNYELGVRTRWFDRTLSLNATAFHEVFTDFQRNDFRGTAFFTFSVPELVTEGVDFDFAWRTPVAGLDFRGGLSFVDAQTSASSNPPPLLDPRLLGTRFSQSPRRTASFGSVYERPLAASLLLRASADVLWTEEYPWRVTAYPNKVAAETRVNARIAFGAADGRWTIELWGQNLLDETHPQGIVDYSLNGGGVIGTLTAPRTYGVTARVSY
jgi:iron complex outermembrane recepter protein